MPLLLCPNCSEGMREVERQDVHIDVCPKCRGVWLDRGELDKLLHSAREADAEYDREREAWARSPQAGGHTPYGGHKRKKRKKHPLMEVFEMFG